jgi:hypothetical protein
MVIAAGCTGSDDQRAPAPEEECLLGGPVAQPGGNRTAYTLNRSHLAEHPPLERVFNGSENPTRMACQDALALMEHLSAEGAEDQEGRGDFDRSAFLTYNEVTRRLTIQHPR